MARFMNQGDLSKFPLTDKEIAKLLAAWPVGRFVFGRPGAGTANPAVIVVTDRGQFFLKQRNPRYSDPGQLAYDHSAIKHLARCGLPVTPPVHTASGSRWLTDEDSIYELYPLVAGNPFTEGNPEQIAAAGRLLGGWHEATQGFQPVGHKPWPRFFDPADRLPQLDEARELLEKGAATGAMAADQARQLLDYLEAQIHLARREVPDARYWALPQVIIHGDWHPGNFKFANSQIAGIFDFDWVARQPRLVDVVDGLIFFCARREYPLDPGDIYLLTQAFEFDWDLMRTFARPYVGTNTLTEEERQCLPGLMRARWLYTRLDAMDRKISEPHRLTFLLPDVDAPLRWLDENASLLASGSWLQSD